MDIKHFLKKRKITDSTVTTSVESEQLNYATTSSSTTRPTPVTAIKLESTSL